MHARDGFFCIKSTNASPAQQKIHDSYVVGDAKDVARENYLRC